MSPSESKLFFCVIDRYEIEDREECRATNRRKTS